MATHQQNRTHRFGLNYVPSQRWYYCWNDWNPDDIARDFEAIASLGIDHIRVQLVWPFFQPNPTQVSQLHLDRLRQLMTLAQSHGLDVLISVLTGWLSGYRFLPPNVEPKDIFLKKDVFEQSTLFFDAVFATVADCDNFLGFDLGNEINVMTPDLSPTDGDAWGSRIASYLRPKLGDKWLVNGVDHHPWMTGRTFSAKHLVKDYDAVCVHAWPLFTSCLSRGGLAEPPSVHLSAFLTYLCRHVLGQAGLEKPVWIQEFGCSGLWGSETEQAAYMRGSVTLAVSAGATWFTWWCSHDIDPVYRFDPLEYDLGLLTIQNKRKPLADVYRALIREFAHAPVSREASPVHFPADFVPAITQVLPPEQWLEQNLETTTWHLFDRYLQSVAK